MYTRTRDETGKCRQIISTLWDKGRELLELELSKIELLKLKMSEKNLEIEFLELELS